MTKPPLFEESPSSIQRIIPSWKETAPPRIACFLCALDQSNPLSSPDNGIPSWAGPAFSQDNIVFAVASVLHYKMQPEDCHCICPASIGASCLTIFLSFCKTLQTCFADNTTVSAPALSATRLVFGGKKLKRLFQIAVSCELGQLPVWIALIGS